ncbi:MAG: hypothetical protein AUJ20_11545 [Comamonadaceae bacterium CG1_02_60_18]|nr:MAG: hypothetical protein AUJ20_11545 [Comamonadaceae bacterium CG1_02_60_18]PIQ55487.1 MAG: hypothetical protein COW02_02575 [Comamonadaceae bacterium CG12_big_fil_rev_8_21_14_0_65_59_15]
MNQQHPPHIDVRQAAQKEQVLQGRETLSNYERLVDVSQGLDANHTVDWTARFEQRVNTSGERAAWLHLTLATQLHLVCQRCLGWVAVPINVERDFRFVATEALAQEQDDDADEDVLVTRRDFDLVELIEDEVLLALPLVPRHDVCPVPVKLAAVDDDFEVAQAKPSPFAALAKLKGRP